MMRLLGMIGRPKSFRRFLIQADSCMNHDAADSLSSTRTPTLAVEGEADEIVARGTFDEAAGCTDRIIRFFQSSRVGTETRS